jgi:hypothetical protein
MVAALVPEVVSKLAVLNSPHPEALLHHLKTNPAQRKRSRYMFQLQVPRLPEMLLRARDYLFIEKALRGWAIDKTAFSDQDIEPGTRFERRYIHACSHRVQQEQPDLVNGRHRLSASGESGPKIAFNRIRIPGSTIE